MADMTYRSLGDSGLRVSAVGIGCNAFSRRADQKAVDAIVAAALETGVTLFDTADVYGDEPGASEVFLGRAMRGHRDELVVATKFGMDMQGANGPDWGARGSRRYVRVAVEASLRRLGTDWIDLYQLHTPDESTPIEETLAALDELVGEGKVRYVGCSNFGAWQLVDADWTARTAGLSRFVSVQNRYSLLDRSVEAELVPACSRLGVGVLPFFPLEYGLLTGKYARSSPPPAGSRLEQERGRLDAADWDRIEAVQSFAKAREVSMLSVAIGGLAAQECVGSVIAGVTRAEQVQANAEAVAWQPSSQDLADLDAATRPLRPALG